MQISMVLIARRKLWFALLLLSFSIGLCPLAYGQQIVPVPKITIYPGERITDDLLEDLTISSRRLQRIPMLLKRKEMIGNVARRTLLPGRPIPANGLRKPDTVVRGKPVRVVFRSQGLTISSQAMPLQSGSTGDMVSFRNLDSGSILTGRIKADGTILVGQL